MDKKKQLDKVRGCLVGGVVCDALGYTVEIISSYMGIKVRYGTQGITRYELAENGKALVSDDTQMTLLTACGLLNAKSNSREYKHSVCYAYTEWLNTQMVGRS